MYRRSVGPEENYHEVDDLASYKAHTLQPMKTPHQQTEHVETTALLRFAPLDPYVDSLKSFVPGVYTHTSL